MRLIYTQHTSTLGLALFDPIDNQGMDERTPSVLFLVTTAEASTNAHMHHEQPHRQRWSGVTDNEAIGSALHTCR